MGIHVWEEFKYVVVKEFATGTHHLKANAVFELKQTGTVDEYKGLFDDLMYNVKLYDRTELGEVWEVGHFVSGLKESIKHHVLSRVAETVSQAYHLARAKDSVMGDIVEGKKKWGQKTGGTKSWEKSKFSTGELWKAQQLKEYRRIHGLCFKCGEKYIPGHQCAQPVKAQALVAETVEPNTILSDEVLEAVIGVEDLGQDPDMFLSLNALSSWSHTGTIHLRALVQNQDLVHNTFVS